MDVLIRNYAFILNLVFLVRCFSWGCIAAIITARLVPVSRERFLSYGARGQPVNTPSEYKGGSGNRPSTQVLDWLASVDVPHAWFVHFYVWSLVLSVFWLFQVTFHTRLLHRISEYVPIQDNKPSAEDSILCIILMLLQSARRLWESHMFSRGSKSRMWIGHYAFGLSFYSIVNIAVWIEGVHSISRIGSEKRSFLSAVKKPRTDLGLVVFSVSSLLQHRAHDHLMRLPKYSVPRHWLFRRLIAPHYTTECGIYLSLAIIAAPTSQVFNWSVLWLGLLTAVNLGITAQGTKTWMLAKFRESEAEIQKKYCMFPGVW